MIIINEIELASNLAHDAVFDELCIHGGLFESDLYNEFYEDGVTNYTENAQKVYDRYYDYYYDEIIECKENEKD